MPAPPTLVYEGFHCRTKMPLPKKICASCKKESIVQKKICPCGIKFKAKPQKYISKTDRPLGRPPKGKKWDAAKKAYV